MKTSRQFWIIQVQFVTIHKYFRMIQEVDGDHLGTTPGSFGPLVAQQGG